MSRQDKSKGNVTALVIESKSFCGDETPTPTGLLRVGEELGIFDELRKVNLFDDAFRKRVESGPNHDVTSTKVSSSKGDELLTPIIFSTSTGSASDLSMGTVEVDDGLMTDESLPETECSPHQKFLGKDSDLNEVSSTKTVFLASQPLANGSILLSKNNITSTITSKSMETAKSLLKSSIMSKSSAKNWVSAVKMQTQSEEKEKSRMRSPNSSSDEVDKETMLKRERNRVAAMRSRKKRKTWVEQLEKSAGAMQAINTRLQSEVTCLRAEVAQLKTLLLAHKDCPVTRAMTQGVAEPRKPEPQVVEIIEQVIPDHYPTRTEQVISSNADDKANSSKLRILLQQKVTNNKPIAETIPVISSVSSVQQTPQTQSIVVVVKSPKTSEPLKKIRLSNCDFDQFIPVIKCNPNAIQSDKSGCESFLSKTISKTKASS